MIDWTKGFDQSGDFPTSSASAFRELFVSLKDDAVLRGLRRRYVGTLKVPPRGCQANNQERAKHSSNCVLTTRRHEARALYWFSSLFLFSHSLSPHQSLGEDQQECRWLSIFSAIRNRSNIHRGASQGIADVTLV